MSENKQTKPEAKDTARQAVADRVISGGSELAMASLLRLIELPIVMPSLAPRLAAAMMVCNKVGILAGQAGGDTGGVLAETNRHYRISQDPGSPPSSNLPTDLESLTSAAMIVAAADEYGESKAADIFRSPMMMADPVFRPKSYYKRQTGPPLAPFKDKSRVITNYVVESDSSPGTVSLSGSWQNIMSVSKKGQAISFMESHFEGKGQQRRDLRGATNYDKEQVRLQVMAWVRGVERGTE